MQICIDPTSPEGIDANLHRCPQGWGDGCKFASIPQALGGSMKIFIDPSMQICIDPTTPEGIDENLHRSPRPRGMDANLHRSHER